MEISVEGRIMGVKLNAIKQIILGRNSGKDYEEMKALTKINRRFKNSIHDIKSTSVYAKKFLLVHFFLKYRVLNPLLSIFDSIFDYIKIKKIPNNPHNYMVKTFDKAFNQACRDWFKFYTQGGRLNGKTKSVITKAVNQTGAVKRLKSIKEWYLTVILMDQAYKEFHNMLMFNLAKEMQKQFKGKTVNHLIYSEKIVDDVNYFRLFNQIQTTVHVGVHEQKESERTSK